MPDRRSMSWSNEAPPWIILQAAQADDEHGGLTGQVPHDPANRGVDRLIDRTQRRFAQCSHNFGIIAPMF